MDKQKIIENMISALIRPIYFADGNFSEKSEAVIRSTCYSIKGFLHSNNIDYTEIEQFSSTKLEGSFFNIDGIINLINAKNISEFFDETTTIYNQLNKILQQPISDIIL